MPVVEEETKEEKAKLVPTSEQLRLAQITQSQDNTMDPQRKAKISQVMDITGKSEDEVATALFDCGWDAARAIDMLLEEGGADGMGSWEETGKKKKKKNVEEEKGEPGRRMKTGTTTLTRTTNLTTTERGRGSGARQG